MPPIRPGARLASPILFVLGAGMVAGALTYDVGTLRRMGPGFFPLVLGVALALLSLAMFADDRKRPVPEAADDPAISAHSSRSPWRAIALPLIAVLAFAMLIRTGGFVPAVLVCTGLAAFAHPANGPRGIAVLAVVLAVLTALVFVFALGIPVRLFGR